jgi:hypothetical protein
MFVTQPVVGDRYVITGMRSSSMMRHHLSLFIGKECIYHEPWARIGNDFQYHGGIFEVVGFDRKLVDAFAILKVNHIRDGKLGPIFQFSGLELEAVHSHREVNCSEEEDLYDQTEA